MADDTILVHIQHCGVKLDALVNECNTVTAIFYDDCDVTNMMPIFSVEAADEVIALAVAEAMRARLV